MKLRRICLSACVVGLLISTTVRVFADSTADVRKAIQAQYDKSNASSTRKDINGVRSIYTSDFVSVDTGGKRYTVDDLVYSATVLFKMADSISGTSTVQTITMRGESATVKVKEHSVIMTKDVQTKSPIKTVIDTITDAVWVKRGSAWLEKSAKSISQTATKDGKPIK